MPNHIRVTSEVGRLRSVLTHCPGLEIELVPSEKTAEWLFEDPLWLQEAQKEYNTLLSVLRAVVGQQNVLEFTSLLRDVLEDQLIRSRVLGALEQAEHLDSGLSNALTSLPSEELARALIQGSLPDHPLVNLFPPTPNLIFTRDIGAVISSGFVIGRAKKPARQRESLLMRLIAAHHPMFTNVVRITLEIPNSERFWLGVDQLFSENPDPDALILSIEGGDLLMFDEHRVFVGCGERTTELAISMLARALFASALVTDVFKVMLPKKRSSMHLDTICTIINKNELAVDERYVGRKGPRRLPIVQMQRRPDGSLREARFDCLEDAVRSIAPSAHFICCGGSSQLFQSREQWSDAVNFLALAPGVVVGYDRNERTLREMEANGYSVTNSRSFLAEWNQKGEQIVNSTSKFIKK